jgi:hypothetical protein
MRLPFGGENIVEPVATPDIPDPRPGTVEYSYALSRDASTRSITAMPWLPQSPDSDEWAKELHDRIEEAERRYAAPNLQLGEYELGTAEEPDEIAVVRGEVENPYVFTAEHATRPINVLTNEYRFPDAGTGGLAAVVAEDYGTALIMRGRQTTNVPSVAEHPIKDLLRQELITAVGFLSIHAKNPGMFVHPDDSAEIHACIGLGREPSEAMREFARKIVLAARDDLGLYVVISNDQPAYIQKPGSTELKRLEDGSPKLSQLAALKPNMTTNFSRDYLRQIGRNAPSIQIELTNLLRVTPPETSKKDRKSRIIGAALGYKLLEKVVELTLVETEEDT